MRNRKNLKYICYTGMMMAVTGVTSFSNHQLVGDILALTGAAIVITMKIVLWRTRIKTA